MGVYETIFLGHENTIDLLFITDGEIVDITNTTRVTVAFGGTVIDSDTSSSAFNWTEGDGKMYLSFGHESIEVGSYHALVTIYDDVNDDGIIWGSFLCRVE